MAANDYDADNREIARRFVEEVWGRGDFDVAREIVHPHVIHFRQRRGEPFGIEGLFQGLRMYGAAFPRRRFTQDDVVVEGDRVADRWTMTAVHSGELLGNPPTGRQVRLTGMNRYVIEEGKIVEVSHDEDIYGLMLQLGGLPAPPPAQAGGWPPPSARRYELPGPQVEPDAGFWSVAGCAVPRTPRVAELVERTDDPGSPWYFPPYPDEAGTRREIEELLELASLRDDPGALVGGEGERRRLAVSPFLQLRPQPVGAVYDLERGPDEPVIRTGRELARWFESETPGLGHRHALNALIRDANWSPARQTRVWMALDAAIHGAMLAAWHYKWLTDRSGVGYRPRPAEVDYRVSVLFNRAVNATGTGDGARRLQPLPSPGTPRHPSYPSGHSTVGGAGSEILSYFFPDYTAEFDQLADNAGMARLWAGIHYRSDHRAGVQLGRAVARLVIEQLEAGCIPAVPHADVTPPTRQELVDRADALRRCCAGRAGAGGAGGEARASSSSRAGLEQARGPQEGAPAPGASSGQAQSDARGPQEGAPGAASREAAAEQGRGPQEGAGGGYPAPPER